MIRVLSCDPGSITTGWAVIEGPSLSHLGSGIIELGKSAVPLWIKIQILKKQMEHLCAQYQPNVLVLEKAFVSLNKDAALKIAQIRGVICGLCADVHDYAEYSPREIKQTITGYGAAEKEQVAFMVQNTFPHLKAFKMKNDQSDAIAIGLCHIYHQRRQKLGG